MRLSELETQFLAAVSKVNRLEKTIADQENKINTLFLIRDESKSEHILVCADCGNKFLMNEGQWEQRFKKGNVYKCSAGHGNVFTQTVK